MQPTEGYGYIYLYIYPSETLNFRKFPKLYIYPSAVSLEFSFKSIIARSALYFLCVRGPARTLVCLSGLSPFFEKIYTEQRQGDHAFTAWCFDRNIQILRVSPVFGPVSSATYASYLRIEGSRKRSLFTVFGSV